jgi:hypothetical protein
VHERQMHTQAWFLTLTYNDDRIPENGALNPDHLRRFFKSMRRREKAAAERQGRKPNPLRYYACGEYGERTKRPHYHAVLFGTDLLDLDPLRTDNGHTVWRSETVESAWSHGFSELGTVTAKSCAYVAGYVRKKVKRAANPYYYTRVNPLTGELVELHEEFQRMSLRPAIARGWIERYWQDVYPRDEVRLNGMTFKPPRYYDKVMDQECREECFAGSCEVHQEVMMHVREKRIEESVEKSRESLRAAEVHHEARVALFSNGGKV